MNTTDNQRESDVPEEENAEADVVENIEEPQPTLEDFPKETGKEKVKSNARESIEMRLHAINDRYGGDTSIYLKPRHPRKVVEDSLSRDDPRYYIHLGKTENYSIAEAQNQVLMGDYPQFMRRRSQDVRCSFKFSGNLDNRGELESEHLFVSGLMGMGKTNLASLVVTQFPRRPNPTSMLWISQKRATIDSDAPKIAEKLKDVDVRTVIIRVGESCPEGKIPLSVLKPEDVRDLFSLSPSHYQIFSGLYQTIRRNGGKMSDAIKHFMDMPIAVKYTNSYEALAEGEIFATKKSEEMRLKKDMCYFWDISKLVRTESNVFSDIVTAAIMEFVYTNTSEKRSAAKAEYVGQGNFAKKMHQSLIIFDELFELSRSLKFMRTLNVALRCATQGRQEGVSLLIGTQTVYGAGGQAERTMLSQTTHLFQFKPSSPSDMNFAIGILGFNKSNYELFFRELFDKVYPATKGESDVFRGKAVFCSVPNKNVEVVKLKLL